MKNNDDFLIVGAGLYGVTIARHLTNNGHKCLVIDKRFHLGGNVYDTPITIEKDNVSYTMTRHDYGPHVFHTSNSLVIDFVTKYAKFNNFRLNVLAIDDDNKLYHMPFNRNTLYDIFGIYDIDKILNIIETEINNYNFINGKELPANLEEQTISLVGKTIYEKLIKNYTEKQWNTSCKNLSPDIIKRLPFRLYFDNNYFDDTFQGIPIGGYTKMIKNILDGNNIDNTSDKPISYILNTDFLKERSQLENTYKNIIYCGSIDELFYFKFGILNWRSLEFKDEYYPFDYKTSQGTAQTNFVGKNTKYTRVIDHIYFTPEVLSKFIGTPVCKTFELPVDWKIGLERYYPINNEENNELYNKYLNELEIYNKEHDMNIIVGGRLGLYQYLDMDDTILAAINMANKLI